MFPLPDGTLRYSPRDLISYLEGDFAAWCDRMYVERQRRATQGTAELDWATPDENDPEAALAPWLDALPSASIEAGRAYLERLAEEGVREPEAEGSP